MTYAQTSDVAIQLGRPATSPEETQQWQAWLDRVERSIVRGFGRSGFSLTDEIAAARVTVEDVSDVEVAAVIRKIQNPTWGETSVTRSIDDASVTTRRDGVGGGDPLLLSDTDWDMLLPASGPTAFSTRPGFQPDYVCDEIYRPFGQGRP